MEGGAIRKKLKPTALKFSIYFMVLFILMYIILFWSSFNKILDQSDTLLINDISRLNPTHIKKIVKDEEVKGIQEVLSEARNNNLKVSIAGKRHSMGGHTFYKNAVVLDMTGFNNVLSVNPESKSVLVQSGSTWQQVIEYLNDYNLSVKVMQAYNTFTVGGSLSVNVHESDIDYGPLVETVNSFTLLLANGTILNVSRTENPELFSLVIGGYGLFGVILDVNLSVTDDVVYRKKEHVWSYKDYHQVVDMVRNNPNIRFVFARLSIAKEDLFLQEVIVTVYELVNVSANHNLEPPKKTGLKKFLFGISRKYDWGKKLRWSLQKKLSDRFEPPIISRNNLMNNDIGYLEYHSSRNTDILQEYFVPVDNLPSFVDDLRSIVGKNDANLLSATLRYVPKNNESFLSYSQKTVLGVVLYFNVGLSEEEQKEVARWTHELTDAAMKHNGTYYLPYQLYASQEQIREAYPQIDAFFEKKKQYDPQELFINTFYEKYALAEQ